MKIRAFVLSCLLFSPLTSLPAAADIAKDQLPPVRALQYHQAQLISAGLPTAEDIGLLADAGVDVVINLIPADAENQLENEGELVSAAGMAYHRINVDWHRPTLANYEDFARMMAQHEGQSVLVHCQLNWRASAFVYLHQQAQGNDDPGIMAPWGNLEESLAKHPQWAELIEQVKARNTP